MNRVLITGASGFLGNWLVRKLAEEGVRVTALVRPTSSTDSLAELGPSVDIAAVEQAGLREWFNALPGSIHYDAVVHFATNYGRAEENAASVVATNVVFSLDLLEGAIHHDVPVFVNIDTCFSPDYPYLQSYTLSKKQFVAWAGVLCSGKSTRFVNLVLQHPFGPGDRPGKFVPWLVEQCLSGVDRIDLTSGDQEKDFIYVADIADACKCILHNVSRLPTGLSTFEVGRGEAVTVKRFVELIHRLSGSSSQLRFGALAQRPGEVMRSVADTTALFALGWKPKFSIEEGAIETLAAATHSTHSGT